MIARPYLLVMTLPCYVDAQGRRSLEALWHKDLVEHLDHIGDLTLAAPAVHDEPKERVLPIDPGLFKGKLTHLDLPACGSTRATVLALPRIVRLLWSAVGRASIVHANAGGWPISLGWLAIPMAKVRGKFALTNVESGGWRMGFKPPWKPKELLQALLFESGAKICVNLSDLATFTHSGYRRTMMLPWRRDRGHVISASWIDPKNILDRAEAEADWGRKLGAGPLRVVFAATLHPLKGVLVLLEAMAELGRRGVEVALDIYGKGELLDECKRVAGMLGGSASIAVRGTLEYGRPFFEMLRSYHLMAVPTLSDEQPRVVYDAFSQALPVVASNTEGLVECVADGRDGKIVPIGDPRALADAIEWAALHRETLRDFGLNAIEVARGLTHDQMHARRAALIERAIREEDAVPGIA